MVRHMASAVDHVLFLVADQWRADALGFLGAPGVQTPHLDALAAEAVAFTNHWCQASPCGPSRSSLLTGTPVATHGQWTNEIIADHELTTLAEAARSAGITPMLIGYTDTPQPDLESGEPGLPYDPAFELIRPYFWQRGWPAYRAFLQQSGYGEIPAGLAGVYPIDGEPDASGLAPSATRAEDSDVAWLTDAALEVIQSRPERSLLHLNWLRPHPPNVAARPYHRLVDPADVDLGKRPLPLAKQLDSHPFFGAAASNRPMREYTQRRMRIEDLTELHERHLRATYYGLIAEVDHHIGRIVAELKAQGRYDSTLIVFGSDHGDALGDKWLYGRRGPFDGHFKVPLIVRDPRLEADPTRSNIVDDFTVNGDIMPTILDALGAETPSTVEGTSLEAFTHGRPTKWRQHVRYDMDWSDHGGSSAEQPRRFSAIRTPEHRYVEFNDLEPMLFDLTNDPDEAINRAGDPALASVQRELSGLLT
jgi:arylsulfatase A-like enzyme